MHPLRTHGSIECLPKVPAAMPTHATVPLPPLPVLTDAERLVRAQAFAEALQRRRTVRDFAPTPCRAR